CEVRDQVRMSLPLAGEAGYFFVIFQTRTIPSWSPLARNSPDGENASAITGWLCSFLNVCLRFPIRQSFLPSAGRVCHPSISPESLPAATSLPSGENTIDWTVVLG